MKNQLFDPGTEFDLNERRSKFRLSSLKLIFHFNLFESETSQSSQIERKKKKEKHALTQFQEAESLLPVRSF